VNDRKVGVALLAPVLVAIAFSWTRTALDVNRAPDDEDYAGARKILDDNGFDKARDALVILPPWSLRPLSIVGDLDPISGDDIADRPLQRYARLWAIVEADADKEHAPLVARRGSPAFSKRAGKVTVERFDLDGPSVLYDLTAHLDDAKVHVDDPTGAVVACDAPIKGGFACPGRDAWQRVDRQWLLVTENASFAVWSHPPKAGSKLAIEWRDVPIGSAVVVQAGFTREGADAAKVPVRLKILVDGEVAGTVVRKPAFRFDVDVIDTKRFAGRTATLSFVEDTDDNASAHYAWDAMVIR
jgi:hypothetical protein